VTVVADDIITADVLATAIVSGGIEALRASTSGWDVDVLAIDLAGDLFATPGFSSAIAAAASLAN
jgi:thiamine biosynthesis lipoprotein